MLRTSESIHNDKSKTFTDILSFLPSCLYLPKQLNNSLIDSGKWLLVFVMVISFSSSVEESAIP